MNQAENPTLCVSFCETAPSRPEPGELLDILGATCQEAGFPYCERLYVGSYFCENFFCWISDSFHENVRNLCREYDMGATLVVPIIGQAFFERAQQRLFDVLDRYGDVYDEVVVNDVALFQQLARETDKRIGLGRLFSKEQRDARYADLAERTAMPKLSAEARDCLKALAARSGEATVPLIEIDPVSAVVDVSALVESAEQTAQPEIAIHLPFCFATTGRNCGPASIDDPDDEKFRLGQGCTQHCLRMAQGYRTREGARYQKHGRTYYFKNPGCGIAGADTWRIIYAAAHETMR